MAALAEMAGTVLAALDANAVGGAAKSVAALRDRVTKLALLVERLKDRQAETKRRIRADNVRVVATAAAEGAVAGGKR